MLLIKSRNCGLNTVTTRAAPTVPGPVTEAPFGVIGLEETARKPTVPHISGRGGSHFEGGSRFLSA